MSTLENQQEITRFRILVIGRANSGKTTVLNAVCGTRVEPIMYDEAGREVSQQGSTNDPIPLTCVLNRLNRR